jgi:ketosteroid isomerase-like protein
MKYCPNCQTRYTDDTLKFCLQDGSLLNEETESAPPTGSLGETETLVSPRQVERLPVDKTEVISGDQEWNAPRTTYVSPEQTPPPHQPSAPKKKSRTFLVVLLTAFVTLLLLALGGIGAWIYMKNNRANVARNETANRQTAESNAKANAKSSPTPTPTPKNENASTNANSVYNTDSTPAPPVDRQQIEDEVSDRVDEWASLTESRNIQRYMSFYADSVDYYNQRNVSADYIRNDKRRAFERFDTIEMNISNLKVTPDARGENATAVFDKEWVFEGDGSYSAGKVQSQLQLKKIGGEWRITSERDLKVYYTE